MVSFFTGVIVSKFGIKELVLDTFPLSSTFRLTLVRTGRGVSIADGELQ